jgi:Zn-dependent M28 family amino/carboxypeptidase
VDISELFTSDTGWSHLEALTDIGGRLPGSDAERRAAELTADALDAAGGRDVRLDSYEITGWERGSSVIAHDTSGETASCLALPRSPDEAATGDLVDLSYGLPEDFAKRDLTNCIVMVAAGVPDGAKRYVHRTEKYGRAVANGAAGFVFRSTIDGDLPMTGSLGTETDPIGEIPAVCVSKETGLRLSRRHEGDQLRVEVDATIEPTTSQNVHAKVGPQTSKEIVLASHVDAHDLGTGAVDNGTGTAMVVELIDALNDCSLDTCVHAIVFGSEEINLVGSEHGARALDLDRVKAIVNLDGVAQTRDLEAHTHGFDELKDVIETTSERLEHPIATSDRILPFSDHWPFVKWGVPTCFVTSTSEGALRGWGHTHGDSLDKVAKRDFREQSILLVALLRRLTDGDVETIPKSPETIAARLEEDGQADGLRAMGWWPYDDAPRDTDGPRGVDEE